MRHPGKSPSTTCQLLYAGARATAILGMLSIPQLQPGSGIGSGGSGRGRSRGRWRYRRHRGNKRGGTSRTSCCRSNSGRRVPSVGVGASRNGDHRACRIFRVEPSVALRHRCGDLRRGQRRDDTSWRICGQSGVRSSTKA